MRFHEEEPVDWYQVWMSAILLILCFLWAIK